MTEAVQIALIVAVGPTLIGLGGLIRGFYSDYQRGKAEAAAAEKVAKVETTLVNSNKETAEKIAEVKTTAQKAAVHVVEVKDALIESDRKHTDQLNAIQVTGEKSLEFQNGAHTAHLEVYAALARRMANETRKEADMAIAELAEKALVDHLEGLKEAQPQVAEHLEKQ